MKLLSPAGYTQSKFEEVGGYKPGFFGRLLGLPVIQGELVPQTTYQKDLTQCRIDFETTPVVLGEKHFEAVAFGTQLYRGITPLTHCHNNVYNCMVDQIERIRVEDAYESPSHYY